MEYYVQLTENCNMRCDYCFLTKYPKRTNLAKAKAVIDWIVNYDKAKSQKPNFGINFYGGEVLLEFPLLKQLTEYVLEKARLAEKRVHFNLRVNLSLFTDEMLAFLKEHHFDVATSIDGGRETHDAVRKLKNGQGSYSRIAKNIPKLLAYQPRAQVNCIISKVNVSETYEMVISLIEAGFKNISFGPNFNDDWTPKDFKHLNSGFERLADYYYQSYQNGTDLYLEAFEKPISQYIRNRPLHCGGGTNLLAIDVEGNVLPCVYLFNLRNKKLFMGNVFKDAELRQTVNFNQFQRAKSCQGCKIQHRCHRTCFGRNYLVTGSFYKSFNVACEFSKIMIRNCDRIAERLYKEKNKRFLERFFPARQSANTEKMRAERGARAINR
jgi:uncharacterized protein